MLGKIGSDLIICRYKNYSKIIYLSYQDKHKAEECLRMCAHNITLDILSFFSSPVKSGLYALLGTFAEVFPEHMIRMSDRLVSIYTSVLKSEVHFFKDGG